MNIGTIIDESALVISIAINVWLYTTYAGMIDDSAELLKDCQEQAEQLIELRYENAVLKAKITPWNKGKKGYHHKHPRSKVTVVEQSDAVGEGTQTFANGGYTIGEYADYYPRDPEVAAAIESAKGGYTSESQL